MLSNLDIIFSSFGFLVFSYSCFASNMARLYFTRSSYIVCIISGKKPFLSVLNKAPFGVIVVFSNTEVSTDLFSILSTFILGTVLSLFNVSGEILYCIIKCGYRLFKSKDTTHLCSPT